jgi:predicted acylesterase/phospholipase RssA
MAERRLALTIKGGVSLGAYEAGAIAETLRLIAFNNTQTTNPGMIPWYVDCACGASAGSMTSAMVVACLVRGDTSVLRNTWVTGVSLAMLAPDDSDMSDNNLLDAGALDSLASQNLTCPTTANRHPALRPAPSEVKLRLTLSRYAPDVDSEDTLNQTKLMFNEYEDSADFTVGIKQVAGSTAIAVDISTSDVASWGYHNPNEALTGSDAWSALVQTAIASGSFPFAFAPRDLRRWVQGGWMDRYFQDGGTFNNDPVGETINIAHDIDWSGKPAAATYEDRERRYMMIHVEPFTGASPETIPNAAITLDVNPLELIKRYFPAILDESQNSSLRQLAVVNDKIVERSKFLGDLANLVATGGVQALPPSILDALAQYRQLGSKLAFLQTQMIPDLEQTDHAIFQQVNGFSAAQKASFTSLALAYDLAVNLADKVKVTPILIAPDLPLSGSGLYAFGGFFVSRMRERDYAQGVYDAYQAWSAVARTPGEFILDTKSPPAAPASAAALFPSCEDEYKQGIDRLSDRVDAMIGALSKAVSGPGLKGDATALVIRKTLDAIANHYLQQADTPP